VSVKPSSIKPHVSQKVLPAPYDAVLDKTVMRSSKRSPTGPVGNLIGSWAFKRPLILFLGPSGFEEPDNIEFAHRPISGLKEFK
jgi:hypothetical protein